MPAEGINRNEPAWSLQENDPSSPESIHIPGPGGHTSVRRRIFLLAAVMVVSCAIVMAVFTFILYRYQLMEYQEMLQVTAQSQARVIEAIALSENDPSATIGKIVRAHEQYEGFGRTGEFTLARLEGDTIVFVLRHREDIVQQPAPVAFDSDLAEPMRRALMGQSGTVTALDYGGVMVLAAYEPVAVLGLGIVAKIDLAEIRAPFMRAGLLAAAIALIVVAIGTLIFFRIGNPIIFRLMAYTKALESEISQRKQAEASRDQLETRLLQAQRMEAIGQLAGGVAHDFNNILQAILGYGEIVLSIVDENSSARESLDQIMLAGERARTLVSQLLAFSRQQVLQMECVDLNETILGIIGMLRRIIGEHVLVKIIPGHQLGTILADRGQLGQILTNLCINSSFAMPDGGTITIETENVLMDEEYCTSHNWSKPGRYVLLSVTDTGCGMDAATLAQVFEPFFTTREVGQGTGLGLSTVYGLVRQHEGTIEVYSEPNKGTIFKIYLPVIERAATSVGDRIDGPVEGGNETILLAEDDGGVLGICSKMLTDAGYSVLTASDGEEALRMLEQNSGTISLALLDVVMPFLGGRAVYDRIQKEYPAIKVLFASGYSTNAIHTNFILDENLKLIQKPYQRASLLRKVREVLDFP